MSTHQLPTSSEIAVLPFPTSTMTESFQSTAGMGQRGDGGMTTYGTYWTIKSKRQ